MFYKPLQNKEMGSFKSTTLDVIESFLRLTY